MTLNNSWHVGALVPYNDKYGGGATCVATCSQGHQITLTITSMQFANRVQSVDLLPPDCPECVAAHEIKNEERAIAHAERDGVAVGAFE